MRPAPPLGARTEGQRRGTPAGSGSRLDRPPRLTSASREFRSRQPPSVGTPEGERSLTIIGHGHSLLFRRVPPVGRARALRRPDGAVSPSLLHVGQGSRSTPGRRSGYCPPGPASAPERAGRGPAGAATPSRCSPSLQSRASRRGGSGSTGVPSTSATWKCAAALTATRFAGSWARRPYPRWHGSSRLPSPRPR